MIKFNRPVNLNGAELKKELNDAGVFITESPHLIDNFLYLNINENDKVKAEAIVAAHNGTTTASEPTLEQKLASVGLNLDDLKAALGL